jgi:hypothetical protein
VKNALAYLRSRGKIAMAVALGASMLAVGGLSVALAAGDGNERPDREEFVAGPFDHVVPAPAPNAETRAEMEKFDECMADEGFPPPEPGERPDISDGPPEGLDEAFEECENLLPEGLPHPPPGAGPGPGGHLECRAIPEGEGSEHDEDRSDSAGESAEG